MSPDSYHKIQVRRPLTASEAIELLQSGAIERRVSRRRSRFKVKASSEPFYSFPRLNDPEGLRARLRDLRGDIQTGYQRFPTAVMVLVRPVPESFEPRLTKLVKHNYELCLEFGRIKKFHGLNPELDRVVGEILSQPCRHIKIYIPGGQRDFVKVVLEPAREVDSPRPIVEFRLDRELRVSPVSKRPAILPGRNSLLALLA